MTHTMQVKTFAPDASAYGDPDLPFEGNNRRGELRGIIKINQETCVGCDTCRKFCPVHAIEGGMGAKHKINDNACVSCGQCLVACPFQAIEQMSFIDEVEKALKDPRKVCIAHPSPAVRVSICEEFGGKPGELTTNQLVNSLERLGFITYDVNSSADQTILEEGTEFVKKFQYWVLGERHEDINEMAEHPFPHFTSCCPAWVRNAETFHAGLLPHLSTAKSPIQMGGTIAKTWAARFVLKRDPRDIYLVSATPCTAKIFEASRPEMNTAWRWNIKHGYIPASTPSFQDVDASITARELAELFRRHDINPLKETNVRERGTLEVYSGAGTIFGCSGGVMEAALRTAFFALAGRNMEDPDITVVRGHDNAIVEATVKVPVAARNNEVFEIRCCVVNGANQGLEEVLRRIEVDKTRYHFIEVMNCPGGCVNGGGQPVQSSGTAWLKPTLPLRA